MANWQKCHQDPLLEDDDRLGLPGPRPRLGKAEEAGLVSGNPGDRDGCLDDQKVRMGKTDAVPPSSGNNQKCGASLQATDGVRKMWHEDGRRVMIYLDVLSCDEVR